MAIDVLTQNHRQIEVGASVSNAIIETCANCSFWIRIRGEIPFKCEKHGIKFFAPGCNTCYSFKAKEDKQDEV